jgi:hypothetical protein
MFSLRSTADTALEIYHSSMPAIVDLGESLTAGIKNLAVKAIRIGDNLPSTPMTHG